MGRCIHATIWRPPRLRPACRQTHRQRPLFRGLMYRDRAVMMPVAAFRPIMAPRATMDWRIANRDIRRHRLPKVHTTESHVNPMAANSQFLDKPKRDQSIPVRLMIRQVIRRMNDENTLWPRQHTHVLTLKPRRRSVYLSQLTWGRLFLHQPDGC